MCLAMIFKCRDNFDIKKLCLHNKNVFFNVLVYAVNKYRFKVDKVYKVKKVYKVYKLRLSLFIIEFEQLFVHSLPTFPLFYWWPKSGQ